MKFVSLVVCVLVLASVCFADKEDQIQAVKDLVSRRFPAISSYLSFAIIPQDNGKDVFELEDTTSSQGNPSYPHIKISGSDGVSIASGLGYYLRNYLHAQMSWSGDQFVNAVPTGLRPIGKKIHIVSPLEYSYYMNTCTHSYTAAWWDWTRWEREIDWMALNGINLPLAFAGQEYVLRQLFVEFGMTKEEVANYFTGPAFLAWFRMGNIQHWAGPLPDSWIDAQHDLQVKILARMRGFGMKPVLSMFAGHVPSDFAKYHPDANITEASQWAGFPDEDRTWMLEVTDPLFNKIAKRYIEIQTEAYGTSHIYNGDVYNEMRPSSSNPGYLQQSAKGTYEGLLSADPDAIWLIQGWLFIYDAGFWKPELVKAYLSGVPDDRMIILDLWTESNPGWSRLDNYYGKKWIWCLLNDFGGNPGMWGNLNQMLTQPNEDMEKQGSTMVGIGLTMEGTGLNYVVYDAALDTKWRSGAVSDVPAWVNRFVLSRYGDVIGNNKDIQQAWSILLTSVYNSNSHNSSVVESFPLFSMPSTYYPEENLEGHRYLAAPVENLYKAWLLMITNDTVAKAGSNIDPFRHDIVDLGLNILTQIHKYTVWDFTAAYQNKDLAKLKAAAARILDLVNDCDALAATDSSFLLGPWIEGAKRLATTDAERTLYEFNARNQLTLWGPSGNINDYAKKSWAGLYADYYYKRWEIFTRHVVTAREQGKDYDDAAYRKEVIDFEFGWPNTHTTYPEKPTGDTIDTARRLYKKYIN